jgi:hypothetical protein
MRIRNGMTVYKFDFVNYEPEGREFPSTALKASESIRVLRFSF